MILSIKGLETGTNEPFFARQICANFCSLTPACDGFFIEGSQDSNCKIVDEDVDRSKIRKTDPDTVLTEYNVKIATNEEAAAFSPGGLPFRVDPELCPEDPIELPSVYCDAIMPRVEAQTFQCDSPGSTYLDAVFKISDSACQGEERITLCKTLAVSGSGLSTPGLRNAFEKSIFAHDGYDSEDSTLTGLSIKLKKNSEVTRIIVRSVGAGSLVSNINLCTFWH